MSLGYKLVCLFLRSGLRSLWWLLSAGLLRPFIGEPLRSCLDSLDNPYLGWCFLFGHPPALVVAQLVPLRALCLDVIFVLPLPLSRRGWVLYLIAHLGIPCATGYSGLSDNLSRLSGLSRLHDIKMRIRLELSRHALYISD